VVVVVVVVAAAVETAALVAVAVAEVSVAEHHLPLNRERARTRGLFFAYLTRPARQSRTNKVTSGSGPS
jgi:hypothetical protein